MKQEFAEKMICKIDDTFGTDFCGRITKLRKMWYNSDFLNRIRRNINSTMVRLRYKIGIKAKNPLCLHLGCGEKRFKGYINIDWRKTGATDLICDIKKLPYPDNSVALIETYHVIEHLPKRILPVALEEWHRVLIPGGKLIIECPDFHEVVREYIQGNEERIYNIFGLQRFSGDAHLFGYNFKRLEQLLENLGFKDIQKKEPQDYHSKDEPCLRVECVKG